jgi:hypothetical protein
MARSETRWRRGMSLCIFWSLAGGNLSPTYDQLPTVLDSPNKLRAEQKLGGDQFAHSGIRPIIAFERHIGHSCDGTIK